MLLGNMSSQATISSVSVWDKSYVYVHSDGGCHGVVSAGRGCVEEGVAVACGQGAVTVMVVVVEREREKERKKERGL